jgi:hypothetical protein
MDAILDLERIEIGKTARFVSNRTTEQREFIAHVLFMWGLAVFQRDNLLLTFI